ncbi:unnamed protein product [Rotaria sordida]|uniref:Signal recognition particle 19 kDa protein n=2 Tax=Rotaria sordida TaxID=392033 RepID=A0A814SMR9_9BILA|nr:unnamed protein product [Rotaria sordida]
MLSIFTRTTTFLLCILAVWNYVLLFRRTFVITFSQRNTIHTLPGEINALSSYGILKGQTAHYYYYYYLKSNNSSFILIHTHFLLLFALVIMATSYSSISQRERNTQPFFPNSATHADQCRFVCIYPAYINAKKTRAQGRRVSKSKAVDNPSVNEIRDILENAGLKAIVEANRLYCREESREPQYRGRVRVQLKNGDESLVKEQFKTKDDLLFYLIEMIPKLKTRSGNQQQQQQQNQQGGGKGKKR